MVAKKVVLIVALIVVFAVIAPAAGLLTIQAVSGANTQTIQNEAHGWRGRGTFAGADIELLDAPTYVSGFKPDGRSEKIISHGAANRLTVSCISADDWGYRWWFRSASGKYPYTVPLSTPTIEGYSPPLGFVLIREHFSPASLATGACPDVGRADASIAEIQGNFIGVIRVEFFVEFEDFFHSNSFHMIASDEATIQPGWGLINILNPDSLVQAGEDLRIHYDVGAACSKHTADEFASPPQNPCGWTLSVRNRETGATPAGWTDKTLGDFKSGDITVPVTAAWFAKGTRNEYEIKLFNQVNLQDAKIFVTIDDKKLAPGKPVVTISPGPPYSQGMAVSVKAVSEPNPITKLPIKDYHIIVRQGNRMLLDVVSPAGTGTFNIADEQVDIQIEVTAFDSERSSGVHRQILTVEDTDLNNQPPSDQTGFMFPLWAILVLAGIALILIMAFVPLPFMWRIVLLLVGAALVLIAVLSLTGVL